jgi:hypothetical protein
MWREGWARLLYFQMQKAWKSSWLSPWSRWVLDMSTMRDWKGPLTIRRLETCYHDACSFPSKLRISRASSVNDLCFLNKQFFSSFRDGSNNGWSSPVASPPRTAARPWFCVSARCAQRTNDVVKISQPVTSHEPWGNQPAFRRTVRQHSFTSSLVESWRISRKVGTALYPYISRFEMAYIASATLVAVVAWSFSKSMYRSKLVDKKQTMVSSRAI